jgi:hypothetical protein
LALKVNGTNALRKKGALTYTIPEKFPVFAPLNEPVFLRLTFLSLTGQKPLGRNHPFYAEDHMFKRWSSKITLGLLLGIVLSLPLFGQAPPSGDTFVSSVTPKLNYGSGISLLVGPGTTSYLQFNLSGIPAGATLSKVSLRLYVDAVIGSGSIDIYQVNKSWNESTLTFNTPAPALGVSATGGNPRSITSASCNQFLLIDITSLAQGWVKGTIPNDGVAIALSSGSGTFSFDSKESLLTGNGPELEIVMGGGAGPQGPAGPQGLQGTTGATGAPGATGAMGPAGPVGPIGAAGPAGVAGTQGPAGVQGPIGLTGAQGPIGPTGAQGAKGDTGAAGLPGAQGPQGLMGLMGLVGPAGPAGPALSSFDSLAGLPCTRNSQSGLIALTYSSSGDVTLNCVLGGGGPPPPPPGPVLTILTTQPSTIPGQAIMVVGTASPVSADLTVSLQIAGQVQIQGAGTAIIPAGSSTVNFPLARIGSNAGTDTFTATAGTSILQTTIQYTGPDFSCAGNSSTTAVDPLVISGTVQALLGAAVGPTSGVLVQAFGADNSLVTSSTTDASGNFSLSIPTGGVPFSGYLFMTNSGFVPASVYWSKPLTQATITTPFVFTSGNIGFFYQPTGQSQNPNDGTVVFSVADCSGTPINDAFLAAGPTGYGPRSAISLGLGGFPPNYWTFNQPAGDATVQANVNGQFFPLVSFTAFSGESTYISITP